MTPKLEPRLLHANHRAVHGLIPAPLPLLIYPRHDYDLSIKDFATPNIPQNCAFLWRYMLEKPASTRAGKTSGLGWDGGKRAKSART